MIDLIVLVAYAWAIVKCLTTLFSKVEGLFQQPTQLIIPKPNVLSTLLEPQPRMASVEENVTTSKLVVLSTKQPEKQVTVSVSEDQLQIKEDIFVVRQKSSSLISEKRQSFEEKKIERSQVKKQQKEILIQKQKEISQIKNFHERKAHNFQKKLSEGSRPLKCQSNNNQPHYFRSFDEVQSPDVHRKSSQEYLIKLIELEDINERLKAEIEIQKNQKKSYIKKIQEIIEHVVQEQEQEITEDSSRGFQEQQLVFNAAKKETLLNQVEREKEFEKKIKENQNLVKEIERLEHIISNLHLEYGSKIELLEEKLKKVQNQKILISKKFQEKAQELEYQLEIKAMNEMDLEISKQKEIESIKKEREDKFTNLAINTSVNESVIHEIQNKKYQEKIANLQEDFKANLQKQKDAYEEKNKENEDLQNKFENLKHELEFVQVQLKTANEVENQLKKQIEKLKKVPNKSQYSYAAKSEIITNDIGRSKNTNSKQNNFEENEMELRQELKVPEKINYAKPTKERQISPSFKAVVEKNIYSPSNTNTDERFTRQSYQPVTKLSSSPNQSRLSSNQSKVTSSIFTGVFNENKSVDKVPLIEKITAPPKSSIFQAETPSNTIFGESSFLNEQNRQYLVNQVKKLKKISLKKTKLLCRSLSKTKQSVHKQTDNIPNILVLIELQNNKLLGAFTQSAFNQIEIANSSPEKSKYISGNKAMILDITNEKAFYNTTTYGTIAYDPKFLIWGQQEFVVSCEEPFLFESNFACENAVYWDQKYPREDLLLSKESKMIIKQMEVYRIYLG